MPIRPEKPEDFEVVDFEMVGRILKDYITPAVVEHLADSRLGDILFEQAFGHPQSEIKPEFWVWRRLDDVPRESDQCPWV